MTSLALSFNEVNFSPVQQDGQIWIASRELGQALGYSREDAVNKIFERNSDEFTVSMARNVKLTLQGQAREVRVFSLRGCHLIAMLSRTAIAKQFRKWVLDILDHEVLNQQIESRQSISPEQQALLHEIVARRSGGERKIFAEMWSRHNRHFKIPRYAELLAIHFPESVHFLETMQLKAKPEKQEIKALPYPPEVIQVAQQINNEYNGGHYHSWFISVRDDGVLSVQPLTKGYYPMNVVEFTKRFDGVLDYLYGSDLLRVGRYLANR
ncbi:Bro-N domain-containing protein [Acinetobacter sp. SCLZS86]|uniref:BRO-N domain-containing protein n=1 Tax=Acinetobacter sp. SCLZS86 TaxID=2908637 RepID=UPI001F2BD8AE|nr:Bro-N domain-containing protein [Acinetobacter sp. SCLZS86]UIZ56282.1 Bro-N domain-containing protein [Acinetobacter sp. SCLZS86]